VSFGVSQRRIRQTTRGGDPPFDPEGRGLEVGRLRKMAREASNFLGAHREEREREREREESAGREQGEASIARTIDHDLIWRARFTLARWLKTRRDATRRTARIGTAFHTRAGPRSEIHDHRSRRRRGSRRRENRSDVAGRSLFSHQPPTTMEATWGPIMGPVSREAQ